MRGGKRGGKLRRERNTERKFPTKIAWKYKYNTQAIFFHRKRNKTTKCRFLFLVGVLAWSFFSPRGRKRGLARLPSHLWELTPPPPPKKNPLPTFATFAVITPAGNHAQNRSDKKIPSLPPKEMWPARWGKITPKWLNGTIYSFLKSIVVQQVISLEYFGFFWHPVPCLLAPFALKKKRRRRGRESVCVWARCVNALPHVCYEYTRRTGPAPPRPPFPQVGRSIRFWEHSQFMHLFFSSFLGFYVDSFLFCNFCWIFFSSANAAR